MLTLMFHREHVMPYRHVVKHFYRLVLKDGIEVRVSKSDFDFILFKRGEDVAFTYRTVCRTRRLEEDEEKAVDQTEFVHFIDETK